MNTASDLIFSPIDIKMIIYLSTCDFTLDSTALTESVSTGLHINVLDSVAFLLLLGYFDDMLPIIS